MRRLALWLWRVLDPPPTTPGPVLEWYRWPCGSTEFAVGYVNETLTGKVIRARIRARLPLEPPPRSATFRGWCYWQAPEPRFVAVEPTLRVLLNFAKAGRSI